ncbi:hypothetical protein ABH922_002986 [Rhodococcus sp. 27YEA15]|uniref:hypothetical protein n=1 Tax=Rhodococcus sp. 27YEA15 TaxID=3156259 RepID=UPI003C7CFF64
MGRSLDFLGTANISWWDLRCILKYPPPGGAISRTADPDHHWDLHAHLLAAISDGIQAGNWQRGGDKKAKRPEQLPRPGVTPPESTKPKTSLPASELRKRLKVDNRPPPQELAGQPEILDVESTEVFDKPGTPKLTEREVLSIRALAAGGCTYADLAKLFHVSRSTIGRIVTRKTWKHLDDN